MMFVANGVCYEVSDIQLQIFNDAADSRLINDLKEAIRLQEEHTEYLERVVQQL